MTTVPIAAQVAEVERELRARAHVYPRLIDKGRLKVETAALHNRDLQAALATLRTVEAYADGLRELIRYLRGAGLAPGEQPSAEERQYLLDHPAVRALVEAFPGAVLTGIAPVVYPGVSTPQGDDETQPEQGELL